MSLLFYVLSLVFIAISADPPPTPCTDPKYKRPKMCRTQKHRCYWKNRKCLPMKDCSQFSGNKRNCKKLGKKSGCYFDRNVRPKMCRRKTTPFAYTLNCKAEVPQRRVFMIETHDNCQPHAWDPTASMKLHCWDHDSRRVAMLFYPNPKCEPIACTEPYFPFEEHPFEVNCPEYKEKYGCDHKVWDIHTIPVDRAWMQTINMKIRDMCPISCDWCPIGGTKAINFTTDDDCTGDDGQSVLFDYEEFCAGRKEPCFDIHHTEECKMVVKNNQCDEGLNNLICRKSCKNCVKK